MECEINEWMNEWMNDRHDLNHSFATTLIPLASNLGSRIFWLLHHTLLINQRKFLSGFYLYNCGLLNTFKEITNRCFNWLSLPETILSLCWNIILIKITYINCSKIFVKTGGRGMCSNLGCFRYLLFYIEVLLLQVLFNKERHHDTIEALHMAGRVFFINFIHLCKSNLVFC